MKQLILALFPAIFIFSEACCQANYYNAINMGQQGLVNNAVIADSILRITIIALSPAAIFPDLL
jgi:hypothetical protein